MVGKRVLKWMVEQVMDLSPGELQIPSPKSLYRLWDDPTTSQSPCFDGPGNAVGRSPTWRTST